MSALARLGRLFPRNKKTEDVTTTVQFDVPAETVWNGMMFYEEVPRRPSPLLRLFIPAPIRTSGEKTVVGSIIKCTYDRGYLEKRITRSTHSHLVEFEILLQELGIEDCITMQGGSYQIRTTASGSDLSLTTTYNGHLRPRGLLRPSEHYLAHRLHHHILDGMRVALEEGAASARRPELASQSAKAPSVSSSASLVGGGASRP